MAKHSAPFYPRLARPATPSFDINDDPGTLMAGSDCETNQRPSRRSSAFTSFASATRRRGANAHAADSPSSSAPLAPPAIGQGATPADALHKSMTPRRTQGGAESLSKSFSARFSSVGPSNSASRSSSSRLSAGSDDEDEEEDEYLPGGSEDEDEGADGIQHGTASIQRSAQTAHASTSRPRQSYYSPDEDSILRDAVKRYGTCWKEVCKFYNESSTCITRSENSLQSRWREMPKEGKAQPNPTARQKKRWTQEETNILLSSIRLRQRKDGPPLYGIHCAEFRKAFPQSTRSDKGIRLKCFKLYQKQVPGHRGSTSHSHPTTPHGGVRPRVSRSTPLEDATPATRGKHVDRNQEHDCVSARAPSASVELPVDFGDTARSLTVRGEGFPISPPGTTSPQVNASSSMLQAQPHPQRQPQQQISRQHRHHALQDRPQAIDVNVLYQQNSICIENCPRDFHVAVYSETLVKITREAPPPAVIAFGTSYEAAFRFYTRPNGAIRALRLPEDTTTDVAPVPPSESCDGGTYIDTVFTGPDDFVVLFRSRL